MSVHFADLRRERSRNLPEGLTARGRVIDRHRLAGVTLQAEGGIEGYLSQKRMAELIGSLARAPVPEDVFPMSALRADVIAHVLDQAKDGHPQLLKHGDGFGGHVQGEILRRRDNHGTGERDRLRQA